jgi:hypothetical protein
MLKVKNLQKLKSVRTNTQVVEINMHLLSFVHCPVSIDLFLPFADVLRGRTGARLGVHGYRVPDGREEQLRDARADGSGAIERLSRVVEAREPGQLHSRLVDG